MIALNIKSVDSFVAKLQRKGVEVSWNGWDMVFFKEDPRAIYSKSGRRRDTRWGFETKVSPNSYGKWLVHPRLTRGVNA